MRAPGIATLVVAAVGGAACYHRPAAAPPPASAPAPAGRSGLAADPLAYLPLDSDVVFQLDATQLRASALWRKLEPMLLAELGGLLDEFRRTCGFDLITSIKRVTVGLKDLHAHPPSGIVVVRGIERAPMMDCVQRKPQAGAREVTVVDGVITVPGEPAGEPATIVTFANEATMVIAIGSDVTPAALTALVARGAPLRGSPGFLELLGQLQTQDALWFAINGGSKSFDRAGLKIRPRSMVGSLELSNGLAAAVRMRLDSADQANSLSATVQGQAGMLGSMFEQLEAIAEDSDLVVKLVMTQDQVEALLAWFKRPASP